MTTRTSVAAAALAIAASAAVCPALAQYAILFNIEDDTLTPGQRTTITLSAAYAPDDWGFALVFTDLVSSQGDRGLRDWELLPPLDGPGTTPGTPSATGIDGILAAKLNFPATGIPPDPNPIDFWSVTYTAPTDVAAPFDVRLTTDTSRFEVYPTREAVFGESRIDLLTEGNATIRVIPAPASALVLLGLVLARRRR